MSDEKLVVATYLVPLAIVAPVLLLCLMDWLTRRKASWLARTKHQTNSTPLP